MPLGLHASSPPLVKTTSGNTVTQLSTAQFSPPDKSLILAFVMQDSTTGGAAPNLGITNNGTALGWITGPVRDSNDPQDYPTAVKVFAAPVPTARTNLIVTGTSNLENDMAVQVYVLTGAHQTSPFGNVTEGSFAGNTLVTTNLIAAFAGSWGFVGAVEGGPLSAAPTPSGFTVANPFIITSEMTGCTGYKPLGAAGSAATFTVDGAGTGSTNWNWVAVEIRAGSTNVTATGIPSAESVSNPTVQRGAVTIDLADDGIPPGNMGTVRVQRPVKTTGIPSAQAFGLPVIGPGLNAVGIKSEESFGSPIIHNYGLGPVGIPSPSVVNNPTVLRGAVTIYPEHPAATPNGIPSQEAVNQPKLNLRIRLGGYGIPSENVFGGTRVRIVQIVPRTVPLRTLTKYELVMVEVVYNTSGPPSFNEIDAIAWSGLSYSDELNKPQSLSTSANIQKLPPALIQRVQNLENLPTELWLRRNSVITYAGPLLGGNVNGEEISFESQGIATYLNGMYVGKNLAYNTDQFLIVKGLVDQWQALEYGHFGIDTSEIGVSGITREISYNVKEIHKVIDRIEDLAKGVNGFDYEVDPATRALKLYYPYMGVDRSQGEDSINFDKTNVTSPNITFSAAPGDVSTVAIGASNNDDGESFLSIQTNPELMSKRGRVGIGASFESDSQATLDSQTQGLLTSRGGIFLVPGGQTRVTKEVDIGKYRIGDTVAYELHQRLQVRGNFRLRKRTVNVTGTGVETADFEFV